MRAKSERILLRGTEGVYIMLYNIIRLDPRMTHIFSFNFNRLETNPKLSLIRIFHVWVRVVFNLASPSK